MNYYTQCEQLLAKVILTVQEVHVPNMRENMQKSRIVSFNNSFRSIIKFHFHAMKKEMVFKIFMFILMIVITQSAREKDIHSANKSTHTPCLTLFSSPKTVIVP